MLCRKVWERTWHFSKPAVAISVSTVNVFNYMVNYKNGGFADEVNLASQLRQQPTVADKLQTNNNKTSTRIRLFHKYALGVSIWHVPDVIFMHCRKAWERTWHLSKPAATHDLIPVIVIPGSGVGTGTSDYSRYPPQGEGGLSRILEHTSARELITHNALPSNIKLPGYGVLQC